MLFDPKWYLDTYPDVSANGTDPLRHYATAGYREGRNPGPLFNAINYMHRHPDVGLKGLNPLHHFLETGRSEGRGAESVCIRGDRLRSQPLRPIEIIDRSAAAVSIAVHVHAYYLDVFEEALAYLKRMPQSFSLFVTIPPAHDKAAVEAMIVASGIDAEPTVKHCQNRGRNFAPMLVEFGEEIGDVDVLLHLHTKKSLSTGSEQTEWRTHLFDCLLPAPEGLSAFFRELERPRGVGLIYPSTFHGMPYWAHHWLSNRHLVDDFFKRIDVTPDLSKQYMDFPCGSMFWCRVDAIRPLLDAKLTYEDFPVEAGQNDGTTAHVIERSIGTLAHVTGHRIAEFDYGTGSLTDNWGRKNFEVYFSRSLDELRKAIDESEIVSFDIFDTLLMRPSLTPDALQHYVGHLVEMAHPDATDFFQVRKAAEEAARKAKDDLGDVDLTEIYAAFPLVCDWRPAAVVFAKETELDIERHVVMPRQPVVDMLLYASEKKKRLLAISDTYFDRETIVDLLSRAGIPDVFERLLISSETGMRKDRAEVWDHVKTEYADKRAYIHIGDNEHSDIQLSGDRGIRNFHVLRPDILLIERDLPVTPDRDWKADLVQGPIANRLAAEPFPQGRRSPIRFKDSHETGFVFYGPTIFGFLSWLMRHPALVGQKKIFFLAREGYFLKKAYDHLKQRLGRTDLPDSAYLYCSRTSAVPAGMCRDYELHRLVSAGNFTGDLHGLLSVRLGIDVALLKSVPNRGISLPRDRRTIDKDLVGLRQTIVELVGEDADVFIDYCSSEGLGEPQSNVIVDVGYSGTIQLAMQAATGKPLVGLYVATKAAIKSVEKDGGESFGYFVDKSTGREHDAFMIEIAGLLESFLTAPHGQVLKMQRVAERFWPKFKPGGHAQKVFQELERIQSGVIDYVDVLVDAYGTHIVDLDIKPAAFEVVNRAMLSGKLHIPAKTGHALSMEDDYCGNSENFIGKRYV